MAEAKAPGRGRRRRRVFSVLLVLVLVLFVVVGGTAFYLNDKIASIPRVGLDLGLPGSGGGSAESDGPLNILIAGTDARDPETVSRLMREGWEPGAVRSDTIMMLHIPRDRESATVVSVPRDTWTAIPGHGMAKINAAFSLGGPQLYLETLEEFTGLQVDHVALIGWEGFKELSTAVGGVDVTVPETVYDSANDLTWTAGRHHIEGEEALQYVRMRYGLTNGDFDRIARQQNFIRAVVDKTLSAGTLSNPFRLASALEALTSNLIVDDSFDTGEIRDLALSLRRLRRDDLTFLTVPLERYDRIDAQSVVIVDEQQARALFRAVDEGRLDQFLATNDIPELPGAGSVS